MSLLKRITAGAIALCTAVSLASCSDTTWVYKTSDTTLASGVYLAMLMDAYMSASQMATDTEKDLFEQKIDNKDAETYIKDAAKESAYNYLALNDKFKELKLTLSDETSSQIDTATESMWGYYGEAYYEKNGTSKASYKEYMKSNYLADEIFQKYYGEGGIEEVKDPELKKEFRKNYYGIKLISMSLYDSEGAKLDDASVKEIKSTAKDYVNRIKNGTEFSKIVNEYNKNLGSSAASQASSETIAVKNDSTDYPDKLMNRIKKASDGEVFTVTVEQDSTDENTSAYGYVFVCQKLDINDCDDAYEKDRETILTNYKSDDFNELIEKWSDEVKVTANSAAVSRYSPKNIKIEQQ